MAESDRMTRYCHQTLSVWIGRMASERRPRASPGVRSISKFSPSNDPETFSSCRTIEPELGLFTVIVHWPFASVPGGDAHVLAVGASPGGTDETTLEVTMALGMLTGGPPSKPLTCTVK